MLIGRLANLLQPASWRLIGPVPRSINDYATHVPVLIGLAKARPIKTVLELGIGHYSTNLFLNRRAFPDLELLDSYETDPDWCNTIRGLIDTHDRVTLKMVDSMTAALDRLKLDNYDLIFVDDSTTAEERTRTIDSLVNKRSNGPLVVIHDFEVTEYVVAARPFRHRYSFRAFNPETGVAWETDRETGATFKAIDAVLRRHSNDLEPDDVEGWLSVFSANH